MDDVTIYTIARETAARIETFTRRVKEGKDLQAAKDFTSYLRWSGVLKILEAHNNTTGPLKVDGALIRWKCGQLEKLVQAQFQSPSNVVHLELSALESINNKLDLLAGHVAKMGHRDEFRISA